INEQTSDTTNRTAASTPIGTGTSRENTGENERDRIATSKTPIAQGEDTTDIKLTAEIRNRVVNTADMSVNARNVKIVTDGGRVTLRGPVNSQAERDTIVRIAREVAGGGNVDDQLEVAATATQP